MSLGSRFAVQFGLTAALAVALALGASLGLFAFRVDRVADDLSAALERSVEERLREDAEALVEGFAPEARKGLETYDRAGLAMAALEAVEGRRVSLLRVYDSYGRLLADASGDPAAYERPAPVQLRAATGADGVIRWREGDMLMSGEALCVEASCLGSVAVGVDGGAVDAERLRAEEAMAAAKRRFFIEAAALGALAAVLVAGMAAVIGRRLGKRLGASLTSAVKALDSIAAGDTTVTIDARDAAMAELAGAVERVAAAVASGRATPGSILDQMADGLFVARFDGTMETANPALHALFGVEPGALEGEDVFETFGVGRVEGGAAIAAALAAVERVRTADGRSVALMVSTRTTGEGEDGRVIGVARDVSERFADSGALQQAQMRAEAADKAKAEFLSVMSHELRTPLNGILGGAAVLAGTELNDQQRGFLRIVQDSGKSMLTLVTDILDFSKADEAGDAAAREPVDLETIGAEIAAGVRADAAAKGLELLVRVRPGAAPILSDPEALLEIGRNLAENAVKFTDRGHVTIDISTVEKNGEAAVTMKVSDSGPGVPKDKQKAIFEAFTQADSSASRAHDGTGLGLSIAAKRAEALGGALDVTSEPGDGAAFTLAFNAPVDADAKRPLQRLPKGTRALVVEPSVRAREILAEQLASGGAEVVAVGSAAEAAIKLRDAADAGAPIDLVTHPESMLEVAGSRELAEWLRGEAPGAATASVALRPEGAPLVAGALPARAQQATQPCPTGTLLDAAAAAIKAARPGEPEEEPSGLGNMKIAPIMLDLPIAQPEKAPPAPKVVLLAESNEVNRIVLTSYLEKAGYVCHAAPNGFEAVKLFKEVRPALVLMDVAMPVMNGVEAAKAIRTHEESESAAPAPVIGLVAGAKDGEKERCAAAGMNDFLAKPIKLDELEAKLERWTVLYSQEGRKASMAS
jgi:signal transduction histidine kinase/DNA-binding response OmpR family regulator